MPRYGDLSSLTVIHSSVSLPGPSGGAPAVGVRPYAPEAGSTEEGMTRAIRVTALVVGPDVPLEDVERIEVISGPGGTLWGVNAVNGVINIITRSAKETEGGLLAAGAGNRASIGSLRYGGKAGQDGAMRVYGKYFDLRHT